MEGDEEQQGEEEEGEDEEEEEEDEDDEDAVPVSTFMSRYFRLACDNTYLVPLTESPA